MLLWIAAAIAASAAPQETERTGATVQARATVRIVAGVRLRLDGAATDGAPAPRQAVVSQGPDGQPASVTLIEFE